MERKISFVIPAYNAESTIEKCIGSIVEQELKCYEVIVVNDGSKDGTLERVKALQLMNPNINLIDIPNGGPSNARNVGLESVSGDYILMIDSDDYFNDSTCIKRYIESMEEDSLDILVFGCQDVFLNQGEVVNVIQSDIKEAFYGSRKEFFDNIGTHMLQKIIYSASNKVYRADIVKERQIRFDTNLLMEEDFLFNICYFEYATRARFVEESPYSYLHEQGAGSLSQKYVPNIKEITKMSFDRLIQLLEKEGAYQGLNKKNIDTYFIKRVSGWINSLFTKSCRLSSYSKIKQIREMMKDSVVQERLESFEVQDKKDKILFVFLKYKCATIAYGVYGLLNMVRK